MLEFDNENLLTLIGVAVQQRPWLSVLEYMEVSDGSWTERKKKNLMTFFTVWRSTCSLAHCQGKEGRVDHFGAVEVFCADCHRHGLSQFQRICSHGSGSTKLFAGPPQLGENC